MPVIKGGRPDQAVTPDKHPRRGPRAPAGHAPMMRRASLAMIGLLAIQSVVGIVVNLNATIPAADAGAGIGPAIGRAISNGPPSLVIHVVLGLALIGCALLLVVRAAAAGRRVVLVAAVAGLAALTGAAFSGASFVASGRNSASVAMAVLAGVAIICYAVSFYAAGRR
jgi:hypothetical protein